MTTETKPRGKRMVRYTAQIVERYQAELSPGHFAILMAAAAHNSDAKAISAALNIYSLGTVKSRLNRARNAMAVLVERDRGKERAA